MNEVLRSLRLEEMQTESSRGGIAVRNVNNRIKLLLVKNMELAYTASLVLVQMWKLRFRPIMTAVLTHLKRWAAAMQKNRKIFTLNRSGFEEETGYETGNTAL